MANDTSQPVAGKPSLVLPGNDSSGAKVSVWIAPDDNAPAGLGRVMVGLADSAGADVSAGAETFSLSGRLLGVLASANPRIAGNFAVSSKTAANDNAVWLGAGTDDEGNEFAGYFGSDVDAATLADGHTVVAWIGEDNAVRGKAVPPANADALASDEASRTAELDKVLGELGHAGNAAGAGRLRLATVGQNGFAALWVADFGLTAALMGKVYLEGGASDGSGGASTHQGGAPWMVKNLAGISVPPGTTLHSVQLAANGALSVRYGSSSGQAFGDQAGSDVIEVVVSLEDALSSQGDEAGLTAIELATMESGEPAQSADAGDTAGPQAGSEDEAPASATSPAAAAAPSTGTTDADATADAGDAGAASADAAAKTSSDTVASAPDGSSGLIEVAQLDVGAPGGVLDGGLPADAAADAAPPASASGEGAGAVGDGSSLGTAGDLSGSPPAAGDGGDLPASGGEGLAGADGAATDAGEGTPPAVITQSPGSPQTIAGLGGSVQQSAPKIIVTATGTAVVVSQTASPEPGKATIVLTPLTPAGQPQMTSSGVPVQTVVTQSAVTFDADHPNLELAPAVTGATGGVAVAWAETAPSDGGTIFAIKMQVFSGDGAALTEQPLTVATSDPGVTLSDFSAGYVRHHQNHVTEATQDSHGAQATVADADGAGADAETAVVADDPAASASAGETDGSTGLAADAVSADGAAVTENADAAATDSAPQITGELVVFWVKDAGDHGYGEIMAQRFGVIETGVTVSGDGDDHAAATLDLVVLVPLGSDGTAENGNDQPFTVAAVNDAGQTEAVIGRAPTVAAVGDDDIAIGWVQETAPGSGTEIIDGIVIDGSSGATVLEFDLSGLMTAGLLRDCDPVIQATANGDIVIAWIERNADGGYDAAAAVYRAAAPGQWVAPSEAIHLTHFQDRPDHAVISLAAGDDPVIAVAWRDGGQIEGAHFSLDGEQIGDGFSAKAPNGSGHDTSDNSGSGNGSVSGDGNDAGAGLTAGDFNFAAASDGSLIIVVAQNGENGQTGIISAVLTTAENRAPIADVVASVTESAAVEVSSGDSTGDTSQQHAASATLDSSGDAAGYLAVEDEDGDQIHFLADEQDNSGSGSGSGGSLGSGSSGSGTSGSDNSGSGNSGSGDSGSDSGGSGDGLLFVSGFGNDVADYYEDEHLFDDLAGTDLDNVFDALQFANALSDMGNLEVITFDVENVVMIRDFETL